MATAIQQTRTVTGARVAAQITAVANQKGGVGKTTTTHNLGVALVRAGQKVLLVDLDPQASLTVSVGVNAERLERSVYDALHAPDVNPRSLVVQTASGVDLLPATIDLSAAEIELASAMARERILKGVLEHVRGEYDDILIDCPPSLGLLTVNALAAADQVLIPQQCQFLGTRGLSLLMRTLAQVRRHFNPELRVAGILPTMYDPRTLHSREVLEELRSNFPNQVCPVAIKATVRAQDAPVSGLSMIEYDPGHEVSRAYVQIAEEFRANE